eukprot:ANDGO_01078.mRNA.1 hypothetical protein
MSSATDAGTKRAAAKDDTDFARGRRRKPVQEPVVDRKPIVSREMSITDDGAPSPPGLRDRYDLAEPPALEFGHIGPRPSDMAAGMTAEIPSAPFQILEQDSEPVFEYIPKSQRGGRSCSGKGEILFSSDLSVLKSEAVGIAKAVVAQMALEQRRALIKDVKDGQFVPDDTDPTDPGEIEHELQLWKTREMKRLWRDLLERQKHLGAADSHSFHST